MSRETIEMVDDDPKQEEVEESTEISEGALPIASDDRETYELVETLDDIVASGQSSEFLRNEYVYEFEQRGKVVRGLTAAAYAHLALVENVSIENMEVDVHNNGYEATAVAVKLDTQQRAYGTAYAPFKDYNGRLDIFARQKAMTKAARNARKQLLPFERVVAAVEALSKVPNALPPQRENQQLPPPQQQQAAEVVDTKDKARKAAFALFNEKETDLMNTLHISKSQFWDAAKAHYKVESRTEMTEQQWRNLRASLNIKGYASWIKDIGKPTEGEPEAEVEETEKSSDASVDDEIPW